MEAYIMVRNFNANDINEMRILAGLFASEASVHSQLGISIDGFLGGVYATLDDDRSIVKVYEDEITGELLGFLIGRVSLLSYLTNPVFSEEFIFVKQAARSQGIAQMLVTSALVDAEAKGAVAAFFASNTGIVGADSLLSGMSFTQLGSTYVKIL